MVYPKIPPNKFRQVGSDVKRVFFCRACGDCAWLTEYTRTCTAVGQVRIRVHVTRSTGDHLTELIRRFDLVLARLPLSLSGSISTIRSRSVTFFSPLLSTLAEQGRLATRAVGILTAASRQLHIYIIKVLVLHRVTAPRAVPGIHPYNVPEREGGSSYAFVQPSTVRSGAGGPASIPNTATPPGLLAPGNWRLAAVNISGALNQVRGPRTLPSLTGVLDMPHAPPSRSLKWAGHPGRLPTSLERRRTGRNLRRVYAALNSGSGRA